MPPMPEITGLTYLTAVELARLYKSRELSPVEATTHAIRRIEQTQPTINAFALIDQEAALRAAQASEKRWRHASPLGPLDGIPIALKDNNWVRGWSTRMGSRTVPDTPSATDAPYVHRLREAGAVFVGKTATPEFCWTGATFSPLHGITRNPWNLQRGVGGSSGGSAAAVAGNVVPIALGTDAGGSIRTPASLCGVAGFKPSFGSVLLDPRDGFSSFNTVGPIAHTAADAEIAFRILQGDTGTSSTKPPNRLDGMKIAISLTMGYAKVVAPEIASAILDSGKLLAELGASISLVDPPLEWPIDVYNTLGWAEQAHALGAIVDEHGQDMEPGLVQIVEEGRRIKLPAYLDATQRRAEIVSSMERFHLSIDVLVTPSLPVTAPLAGDLSPAGNDVTKMNDWLPFSSVFNLTGQPALSLPCAFDSEGLPFGIQFVAARGEDNIVLNVARAYEVASDQQSRIRTAYARLRYDHEKPSEAQGS